MRTWTTLGQIMLLIVIVSLLSLVSAQRYDYSNPQDYYVDLTLSLNQTGYDMTFGGLVVYGNVTMLPTGMAYTIFNGSYTQMIFPYWISPYDYTKYAYWSYPSSILTIYDDLEVEDDVNIQDDLDVSDHISCNGIEPAWIRIGGVPSGGFYVDTWDANFSVLVDFFEGINVTNNATIDYLEITNPATSCETAGTNCFTVQVNGSTQTCVCFDYEHGQNVSYELNKNPNNDALYAGWCNSTTYVIGNLTRIKAGGYCG